MIIRIIFLVIEIVLQLALEVYRTENYYRLAGPFGVSLVYLNFALLIVIGFTFTYKAFVPKNKKLPVLLLGFSTICFILCLAGLFNAKIFTGAMTYTPLLLGVSAGLVMTKRE